MIRKRLLWGGYYLLASLILAELALRLLAYEPYQHQAFAVQSEPAGWLRGDSLYGFALTEGQYHIQLDSAYHFSARHLPEGRRSPKDENHTTSAETIDLYGCSYAYGYGVGEEHTLGALLETASPNAQIRNWSVPGHGTTQAWLRLQSQLARGDTPQTVIILYASFHADRNSLTAEYRRGLKLGFSENTSEETTARFRYPYLGDDGELHYQAWEGLYEHWPGRTWSALINALQSSIEFWQSSNRRKETLSLELLLQIASLCEESGIRFLFCPLDRESESMRTKIAAQGYETIALSLDLSLPKWQNFPYDTHPNAAAHAHYAREIEKYLRQHPTQQRQNVR
ncbi:MAG: hypothetical protein AAFQ68_10375 [Bacteroidota bacterium]